MVASDVRKRPQLIYKVSQEEILEMLTHAAAQHGLTVQQVDALWLDEEQWLDIPELRDLWLIWRDI